MNSPSINPNSPNACPDCATKILLEPTALFGDMDCPQCHQKLWFLTAAGSARFYVYDSSAELRQRAIEFIARRLEVDHAELAANPGMVNELETDSLEALELVMDMEEELGLV